MKTLKERRIALGVPRIVVARAIGDLAGSTVAYVEKKEGDPYVRVAEARIREVIERWEKDGPPELDLSEQQLVASEVANIEALAKAAKRASGAVPAAQLLAARAERDAADNARWSNLAAARNARKLEITERLRAIRASFGISTPALAQETGIPLGTIGQAEREQNTISVGTMERILEAYELAAERRGATKEKATPKAAAAAK